MINKEANSSYDVQEFQPRNIFRKNRTVLRKRNLETDQTRPNNINNEPDNEIPAKSKGNVYRESNSGMR